MLVVVQRTDSARLGTEPVADDKRKRQRFKNASRYPPGTRGSSRMVVSTDIVGLGLIGFSVNCLMVVFNTIGIEKKDTDKLPGGWGLSHLSLGAMMILVGVATFMTNPTTVDAISGFFGIALVFYGFFWVFLGASLVRG